MKKPLKPTMQQLGGKARKKALSPQRRQEIARQAALTRWSKRKPTV